MQTGPRGQREWKFYETVQHEKQAAAAASSTVGEPHASRRHIKQRAYSTHA